jgi:hypothetical protein
MSAIQPPSNTGIYAGAPQVASSPSAAPIKYDTVPEVTQLIRYEALPSNPNPPRNAGFYDSPDSEFQK